MMPTLFPEAVPKTNLETAQEYYEKRPGFGEAGLTFVHPNHDTQQLLL